MTTSSERLAIVETKVKSFEKAMEAIPGRFSSIVDKLDRILTRHEDKIRDVISAELKLYRSRLSEIENKQRELEVVRFLSKYPKITLIILFVFYLMAIEDFRDVLLSLIGVF